MNLNNTPIIFQKTIKNSCQMISLKVSSDLKK